MKKNISAHATTACGTVLILTRFDIHNTRKSSVLYVATKEAKNLTKWIKFVFNAMKYFYGHDHEKHD